MPVIRGINQNSIIPIRKLWAENTINAATLKTNNKIIELRKLNCFAVIISNSFPKAGKTFDNL